MKFSTLIRRVRKVSPEAADWLQDEYHKTFNENGVDTSGINKVNPVFVEKANLELSSMFSWKSSPQGHNFWSYIHSEMVDRGLYN